MADDASSDADRWHDQTLADVQDFADKLGKHRETNPWPNHDSLGYSIVYLMTELWDRGFSNEELETAFKSAVEELPKYSGGYDKLSDK